MDRKRQAAERLRVRVKKHRIREELQNDSSSESDSEIAVDSSLEGNLIF